MKALPIKKQIEVLKLALEIYNDVERRIEASPCCRENAGICVCICEALKQKVTGEYISYHQLYEYIPCFNFYDIKMLSCGGLIPPMCSNAVEGGFWWNNYDWTIRPIVLQYLIDSYNKK
jgi:hypothetical protein